MNDYLELIKQTALTKSIESEEITFYISEGSFKIITLTRPKFARQRKHQVFFNFLNIAPNFIINEILAD